jgi:hypothetical protein
MLTRGSLCGKGVDEIGMKKGIGEKEMFYTRIHKICTGYSQGLVNSEQGGSLLTGTGFEGLERGHLARANHCGCAVGERGV